MSFTGFLSIWTEWLFPGDKTKSHISFYVGSGIRRLEGILGGTQSLGSGMLCVLFSGQGTDYKQEHPSLRGLCNRHLIWTSQDPLLSLSV